MKETIIFVPEPKIIEMVEASACMSISEQNGKVVDTVWFDRKEYVITGFMSSGREGIISVWGNEVILLSLYTGDITPLHHNQHSNEVAREKREREYSGLIVFHQRRELVMLKPQVTFKSTKEGIQVSLF